MCRILQSCTCVLLAGCLVSAAGGFSVGPAAPRPHAVRSRPLLLKSPLEVVEDAVNKIKLLVQQQGQQQEEEEEQPAQQPADAEGEDDGKMTLEKVASFGIAGVLSIAVAESVFWILSFPLSEALYFASTGEWIDLLSQEGQLKFLAFTAGWGALGGVIAQYRTVLTAAAMTPWMDANVVRPYVNPLLERFKKDA